MALTSEPGFSGINTPDLTVTAVNDNANAQFKCNVSGLCPGGGLSSAATLYVISTAISTFFLRYSTPLGELIFILRNCHMRLEMRIENFFSALRKNNCRFDWVKRKSSYLRFNEPIDDFREEVRWFFFVQSFLSWQAVTQLLSGAPDKGLYGVPDLSI